MTSDPAKSKYKIVVLIRIRADSFGLSALYNGNCLIAPEVIRRNCWSFNFYRSISNRFAYSDSDFTYLMQIQGPAEKYSV